MFPTPLATAAEAGFDRWVEFLLLVLVLLAFDLFVVHRKAHVIGIREAAGWSVFWIALAFLFNGWVWWEYGGTKATEFLTAYVVEKALSVDNLFVFLTVFTFFKVAPVHRHRVLFLGILGALVFRGLFIFLGAEVLNRFEWTFHLFGAFLVFTAWKLARGGSSDFDPRTNFVYRWARKFLPLTDGERDGKFFVREGGRWLATPLFVCVLVVEGTDVVFAVDSVPACLAISRDLFIVYTSNVFAILGLRALFFLIESVLASLPGLGAGLALVLAFVGGKMILIPLGVHVNPRISLAVILGLLVGSWLVARWWKGRGGSEEDRGG